MTDETLKSLTALRVGRSRGRLAANKPCLLLAIICEIQNGHINTPTVAIDDRLLGPVDVLRDSIGRIGANSQNTGSDTNKLRACHAPTDAHG
jgi:hypothetical protein